MPLLTSIDTGRSLIFVVMMAAEIISGQHVCSISIVHNKSCTYSTKISIKQILLIHVITIYVAV